LPDDDPLFVAEFDDDDLDLDDLEDPELMRERGLILENLDAPPQPVTYSAGSRTTSA
jgi:hypothetical protein